jgi:hypothetical protein
MGDSLHKKPPPPSEEEEDVTDDFRRDARATMERNRDLNAISGAVEKDPSYLIDSQAALARVLKVSDKHISNILGPVRKGSKWDRVDRSTYVRPIREALRMPTMISVSVPKSRAEIVQWFALLPEDEFSSFERALHAARERALASKR